MNLISRLAVVPVLVYGLAEGLARGLNLAVLPLLTRLFTTEQFGEIAILSTVGSLVGMLANCGLSNAVHRFYFEPSATSESRRLSISAGFWTLFALCVLLVVGTCGLLWGASSIARFALPQLSFTFLLCLLAVIPTQLVQFGQDILRLYSAHWQYFFVSVLKTAAAFAIGIGLVYWGDAGVTGYLCGLLAGQLLLLGWIAVRLSEFLRIKPDWREAIRLAKYGSPFVVAGLAQWFMASAELWALRMLVGISEVGVYAVCLKLSAIVSLVTTAFGLAWSPEVLRLHAEDKDYRSIAGNTSLKLTSFLIFFATVFTAIVPYVFSWLIPPEYGRPSFVMTTLAFSAAIMGTSQVTILGLVFEKRSDLIAKVNWAVAIVSTGLSWCLIPFFGVRGAAVSNLLASTLLTGSYFAITCRIHALEYSRLDVRFLWLFTGCCTLAVTFMNVPNDWTDGLLVRGLLLGALFLWLWKSGGWGMLLRQRPTGV
jgi:O-antigen/teichoic acid export membrane protein